MFKRKGQRSSHSAKSYSADDRVDKANNDDICSGTLSNSSQNYSTAMKKPNMKQSRQPSTVASTQSASRSFDDNVSSIQSCRKTNTRSVTFSDIHIREFERILGDNPSCSSGAPIS
jgi:hypothetical protein